jgi:hypothetical protein
MLQRRHEGQLNAFALDEAGFRIGVLAGRQVGVGLEPDWLGDHLTQVVRVVPGRGVVRVQDAGAPVRRQPQAGAGGDPVQPGPQ